jgi:hypothetical protein
MSLQPELGLTCTFDYKYSAPTALPGLSAIALAAAEGLSGFEPFHLRHSSGLLF